MILKKNNALLTYFLLLILSFSFLLVSGCSTYIAAKQDDILTQIDVWANEQEYGKAFETLNYVKKSHPQYERLQQRKKTLQIEVQEYEQNVHQEIINLISKNHWAEALDLLDRAKKKYPQGKILEKTQQLLLDRQANELQKLAQKLMLERSQWMIVALPLYKQKTIISPRDKDFKKQLEALNKEARELATQVTQLSRQEIRQGHYKQAIKHIKQALALHSNSEREQILKQLKKRASKSYKRKKKAKSAKIKKQQNTILLEIEKNFQNGNLIKTRMLINTLNKSERNNPELIQLEQELARSIKYRTQYHFSEANKFYTDGQFQQAIAHWEQVLLYDPENKIARKNILRARKVIKKLQTLREKQKN